MSRKTNYYQIGLFVIAGIAIAVVGLVMLGAGAVFREYVEMETYFDESVQGLEVGSAVKNRGVQIGTVKDIKFASSEYMLGPADPNFYTFGRYILIRMRIRRENARALFGGDMEREGATAMKRMISNGLRVQLTPQGITGVSYLEVDYVALAGDPVMEVPWAPNTLYIPSVQSLISNLKSSGMNLVQRIEQLDIEGIVERTTAVLDTLTTSVQHAHVEEIAEQAKELLNETRETNGRIRELLGKKELETALDDAGATMRSARENMPEIMENLKKISANMAEVSDEMGKLSGDGSFRNLVQNIESISSDLKGVSGKMPETTEAANRTLARLDRVIAGQQADLAAITENMRVISENLKTITANMKQSPAQTLLGGPPPKFNPERPK